MLSLQDITYTIDRDGEDLHLLHEVSAELPAAHFMAIVGPSGCGKTTLLKIIAGLQVETAGRIFWKGRDLAEDGELSPQELGYVPQFSIAHDHLSVEECVENAVLLRTRARGAAVHDLADRVMAETGMESMRDKRVAILSGGQKRRLGLAMELVSSPALLLCDEVTSGLDPQSENEIVRLLHRLSREHGRSVVNVTHSLSHLELYDSVLVLVEGRAAYHGPPQALRHYFSVESEEEIYPRLMERPAADWHASWHKRRQVYYEKLGLKSIVPPPDPDVKEAAGTAVLYGEEPSIAPESSKPEEEGRASETHENDVRPPRLPGVLRQFRVLFGRRWTLFFRDRTQCLLQLALLLGFPLLVALFAWDGLGPMPERSVSADTPVAEALQIQARAVSAQARLGALISGLVMFQVVLLTLMGSNNSAREVAGERLIYEKERLGGLRPFAYLLSKIAFLAVLVTLQSVWMGVFVDFFAHLPGAFMDRLWQLVLVNGAMTAVCLAISSLMKSPEQASLLSIYLVGFQLPLSGAVLALPGTLEKIVQPFIAAYWSWSGQLSVMRPSDYFVGISEVPTSIVAAPGISLAVLGAHLVIGLFVAWAGCHRRLWD